MPDGREVFWPFSNPPYVEDEDSIDIAEFSADNQDKRDYREYLAGKYGKRLMLYSGIHFNYSLRDETLAEACRGTGMEFREFKNNVYLNLAKRLTKLGWFIVYLLAASPVIDESFLKKSGKGISTVTTYASPRCSEKGYWNDFTPILDYSTLEGYAASIEAYVESGDLIAPRELYYPVRVKPAGANSLDNLKEKGVNHIEIRVVDLNPFAKAGIFEEDIKLLHVLILYLLSLGETSFTPEEQEEAMTRMKEAAKLDGGSFGSRNETEALDLLSTIEEFYKGLGEPYGPELIAYQRAKVTDRSKSYPAMVIEAFGENYLEEGLKLAGEYQEDSMVESDDGDKSQVI
jgi:glutamate--cysteine ligase